MFKESTFEGVEYPNQYPKPKNLGLGYCDSILLYTGTIQMSRIRVLFYPRKDKMKKNNWCPVYMRITINKKIAQCSLNIAVDPDKWDADRQLLRGRDANATLVNDMLEATKVQVYDLNRRLMVAGKIVGPKEFLDLWTGRTAQDPDFLQWMELRIKHQYNQNLITFNTYRCRDLVCRLLHEFKPGILFTDVNTDFVFEFSRWLKTKITANAHSKLVAGGDNTVNKYLKVLKTYVAMAMREFPGKITRNPFDDYKLIFRPVEKVPLSIYQVQQLWQLYNDKSSMDAGYYRVLWAFLFQIHTGLRVSDLRTLRKSDIATVPHKDGYVLVITKVPVKTQRYGKKLVLPVPSMFLNYVADRKDLIFDLPSEPRYNMALKEIGVLMGFDMPLTSHIARHTFATINMQMGENPMVTMNLMGHSSLNMTSIYTHHVIGQHVDAIEKLGNLILGH